MESKFKKYHPIKYEKNEDLRFIVNTENHFCSMCKKEIKYQEIIFTFQYYMRFHLSCIEEFNRQLNDFMQSKSQDLCMEMLKNGA